MDDDERLAQYARQLSPDACRILAGAAERDAVTVHALQRGGLLDDNLEPTADGRAVLAILRIREMAALIVENDGLDLPHEQAQRVYAHVVAPLLWLHAEAVWRLDRERDAHAATVAAADASDASWRAIVDQWERGHQDEVLPHTAELEAEVERLRREVEFEANAETFGPDPVALARYFHATYEELAPEFGYETRAASAKPWADVPANNRELMVAVADRVLAWLAAGGE